MQHPSTPDNEAQRLNELARYDALDSAEAAFDELTAFIAKTCGTPIALLTLLDENRQWFKSSVGLGVTETPRAISFCGHAILNPDHVMIVPDARRDERFFDNPLVTSTPDIRFYAGTPLVTQDGYPLGTLCVIDVVPRTLTSEQLELLQLAGRMAIKLFEQRLSAKLLETATAAQRIAEAALHAEIARRGRVEDQLSLAASHDCLTQLPNRTQFLSRLHTSLARLHAGSGKKFGVCFIDLDQFKQINDTLGHRAGDELLTEVGRSLASAQRSRDVVARLGGDESRCSSTALRRKG